MSKRFFSLDTRKEALAGQKRRKAERGRLAATPAGQAWLSVVVTRSEPEGTKFVWQVRKFGALILRQSVSLFATSALARAEGEREFDRINTEHKEPAA